MADDTAIYELIHVRLRDQEFPRLLIRKCSSKFKNTKCWIDVANNFKLENWLFSRLLITKFSSNLNNSKWRIQDGEKYCNICKYNVTGRRSQRIVTFLQSTSNLLFFGSLISNYLLNLKTQTGRIKAVNEFYF